MLPYALSTHPLDTAEFFGHAFLRSKEHSEGAADWLCQWIQPTLGKPEEVGPSVIHHVARRVVV
jgi:hypothetical protein